MHIGCCALSVCVDCRTFIFTILSSHIHRNKSICHHKYLCFSDHTATTHIYILTVIALSIQKTQKNIHKYMPAADVTRLVDHHTIGRCATLPKRIRAPPRTFVVIYIILPFVINRLCFRCAVVLFLYNE